MQRSNVTRDRSHGRKVHPFPAVLLRGSYGARISESPACYAFVHATNRNPAAQEAQ